MQTKRPDGLNHPDAHPPSAPAGGGPEGAEAPAETRNHIQSAPEGSSAAGGAAKSRPQDCNRIRRLRRRGGSFSAPRKTFLTLANGREEGFALRPVSECKLKKVARRPLF